MALEIPPNGSRGAWMPSPGVLRQARTLVVSLLYRLTAGQLVGRHSLLLQTIGARSGTQRTAYLRRFDDGDGRWLVVGTNGGSAKHPAWLVNLSHHPDQVWVEVRRDRVKVKPELLRGAERAAAWQRVVTEAGRFGRYQDMTDREIAVVRLSRETSG